MTNHPTREEDFDLYALGALEGDDRRAIESHVASCTGCARKLAEAQGLISMLALYAPPVPPSAAVKQRLMERVRADAAQTISAQPPRPPHKPMREPGFLSRWWTGLLIPAAAALAVATILLWTENRQLDRQLAALRSAAVEQQNQLADARQVAGLIESPDTISVPLAPQPGQPAGSARVLYNAKSGILLYDGQIAPAPPAKSYQLWLVPAAGNPISAGVFNPVTGRADHLLTQLPPGVVPKVFAVTLEPAGGVPQPTGPMVLVGHG